MSSNALLDPPRKRNLGAGTRLEPLRPKGVGSGSRTGSSSATNRPNYASSTGALRSRLTGSAGPTQPIGASTVRTGSLSRRPSSADTTGTGAAHARGASVGAKKLPVNARHGGTTAKSQPRAPASKRPVLSPAAVQSSSTGRDTSEPVRARSSAAATAQPRASLCNNNGGATSPSAGGKTRRGSSPKASAAASTGGAFFTGAATAKRRASGTSSSATAVAAVAGKTTHASGQSSANTSHSRGADVGNVAPGSAADLEARRRIPAATRVVQPASGTAASPLQQQAATAGRSRSRATGDGATVHVGGTLPSAAYTGTVKYCSQKALWNTKLPETVRVVLDGDGLEPPFRTHLWKQAYDEPGAISADGDSYVDFYAFGTDAEYQAAVDVQRRHPSMVDGRVRAGVGAATQSTEDPRLNPHLHSCPKKIVNGFYACVRCHMPIVCPRYQVVNVKERGIAAFSHVNTAAIDVQLSTHALVSAMQRAEAGGKGHGSGGGQRPSLAPGGLTSDAGASGAMAGLVFLAKCRACGACLGVLSHDIPAAMAKDAPSGEVFYANSSCLEYMAVEMLDVRFDGTVTQEVEAADAAGHRDVSDDEADAVDAIGRDVNAWFDEGDADEAEEDCESREESSVDEDGWG